VNELQITEAASVQFPMVAHAVEIGWTPITPEIARRKRGGETGMLFRNELEATLEKLNPWMTRDAIRQVIEKLEATPPTIDGNREMLAWLRGDRQWYDETEQRSRPVRLVNFEAPGENVLQVTWEWKIKPPARKGNRADVMFVVNGVPVCIVEHKNPKDGDAIDRGVTQLRRYEKETPELMGASQLFNVTHLLGYWYGVTWNFNRRFMARWKQPPDETYRFAVQAFFEPTDFLRTLQHWILFYVEDGETRKSVLRQHQRAAIDKIVARCADPSKRRGLVWHTQGSGKTFTLLTAARLILEDKDGFRNATVILVVDRTELEGQLKGWVEKLLGEMQQQDIPVHRANSKAEVRELEGYLDKYSIRESIEDETTLPIRHTMAPSEMTAPMEQLDREFFELAGAEGVTDVEELNKVLDRAVGLRAFLTADDRIEKVADFVAGHFRENVLPLGYKAFLVGVNREACAKYKRALDRRLPPEWSEAVYTESAADAIDRPLVAEVQLSAEREADVRLLFKKADENPKILIVTDKLLTGYDAPLLYCLYLDKPMRDHVLLQAIARVNRPYVDAEGVRKRVGLVIDFVGVLRELKKALKFDSTDVSGVIEDLDLLLADLLDKIDAAAGDYLETGDGDSADEHLERTVYGRLLDPESRRAFFDAYKEIEALWEIVSPAPELRDHIATFRRLARLYAAVRNAYQDNLGYLADLAHKTRRLVQESASQEGLGRIVKTVVFDVKTLEGLRGEPGSDEAKVFNLVRGLRKEIDEKSDAAPLLQSLKDRAARILKDLEDRNTTGLAAMDELAALVGEKEEALRAAGDSGLSTRAFGVYWHLKKDPALYEAGIPAMEPAKVAEEALAKYPNARVNAEEQRRLRAELYPPLLELNQEERARLVDLIFEILIDGGD